MKRHLNALHAMNSIDGLSGSLIGIFIPIYLLTLGYSLTQVFLYFIVYSLATLAFFVLAGFVSSLIGLRRTIMIRYPFHLLYVMMLMFLGRYDVSIYLIACVNAVSVAFYFFPMHVIFSHSASSEEMGDHVGKLLAIPQFVGIFGPLIGSLVAKAFGFDYLFLASISIFLFSLIPLFYLPEMKSRITFHWSRFVGLFRRYQDYFWAEFFENIGEEVEGIIWPIFIYLSVRDVVSVGAIGTFMGVVGAVCTYLLGKKVNKTNARSIFRVGVFFMSMLWLSRYFLFTPFYFVLSSLMAAFFGILVTIPFNSIIYASAKDNNIDEFIIFREVPIVLARVVIYMFGILLVTNIKAGFFISAVSYFSLLFFAL